MEYEELRRMFDLNNSLIEKINNFRNGRIVKYESENPEYYKVIFHAVPLNAFSNNSINLEKAKNELTYGRLIARNYIYNFLMDYIIIAKSICNFSEMELLKDVIQFPTKMSECT